MTALNIVIKRDRAAIFCDTAIYNLEGVVRGFAAKVVPIPHMRMAVISRGVAFAAATFSVALGLYVKTFDELVAQGGAIVEDVFFDNVQYFEASGQSNVQLVFVGWSEAQGRMVAYMCSSLSEDGSEPFEFRMLTHAITAGPIPSAAAMAAAGLDADLDLSTFNLVADGLKLLEAQRSEKFPIYTDDGPAGELCVVGGDAVLTEITRDGISQRVLRSWNDEVGTVMNPAPLIPVQHLTRQQKRAMERDARKKRAA